MEIAVIIASLLTLLLMFFFLGYTDIPVKNYTTNLSLGELYTIPAGFTSSELDTINTLYPVTTSNTSGRNGATVEILVSFSVYVIALIGACVLSERLQFACRKHRFVPRSQFIMRTRPLAQDG
jgi:hypothetical protein